MPYRQTTERPPEIEDDESSRDSSAGESDAVCTRCNVSVPAGDDRCPKCLRRSGLSRDGLGARPTPKVWPYTKTCPLCGTRDVSEAQFFFRVSKTAVLGRVASLIVTRGRCCALCRASLERYEWHRYASVIAVLLGLALVSFVFVPGGPRVAGVLGVVVLAAGLATFIRRGRALRSVLDAEGISDRLAEKVPAPAGVTHEVRALHSRMPETVHVVDLAEVLEDAPKIDYRLDV